MNKYLNIRGKTKVLVRSGYIFIVLLAIAFIGSLSFLHSLKDENYSDLFEENTQYYGKYYAENVNNMFAQALKNYTSDSSHLDSIYPMFNFHYRLMYDEISNDSVIDWNTLRLVGYIPANNSDSTFYYNSHLYNDLELQRGNLGAQLFVVEPFENKDLFGIKSITIQPNLHSSKIDNYFWEGEIWTNTHNLFDSALVLRYGSTEFYLRNLNEFPAQEGAPIVVNINVIDSFYSKQTYYSFEEKYNIYNQNQGFSIADSSGNSLLIINFAKDSVKIRAVYQGDVRVFNSTKIDSLIPGKEYLYSARNEIHVVIENEHEWILSYKQSSNVISKMTRTNQSKERSSFGLEQDSFLLSMAYEISAYEDKLKYVHTGESNKHAAQKRNDTISVNKDLNEILNNYLKERVEYLELEDTNHLKNVKIGITLMNTNTGEILALADHDFERVGKNTTNVNYTNHWIGSTFKPILATACISNYPRLIDYVLHFDRNGTSSKKSFEKYNSEKPISEQESISLLGYPMSTLSSTAVYVPQESHSFKDLFNYSLNVYPNALLLLTLSHRNMDGGFEFGDRIAKQIIEGEFNNIKTLRSDEDDISCSTCVKGHSNVLEVDVKTNQLMIDQGSTFNKTLFAQSLNSLFDLDIADGSTYIDISPFQRMRYLTIDSMFKSHFYSVSPEGNISSLSHLNNSNSKNYRGEIVSWVLGAGNNYWNNVKLTEAYCRIVSRKKIDASLVKLPINKDNTDIITHWLNDVQSLVNPSYNYRLNQSDLSYVTIDRSWDSLVTYMGESKTAGKAFSLLSTVSNDTDFVEILGKELNLKLLCKTGTPNKRIDKVYKFSEDGNKINQFVKHTQGLFAFTVMQETEFEKLIGLSNYSQDSLKLGITGVVYISHDSEADSEDNAKSAPEVNSGYAVDIFADEEFLKTLILLNSKYF